MKKKSLLMFSILIVIMMLFSACSENTDSPTNDKTVDDSSKVENKTSNSTRTQIYFSTGTPGGVYQMLGAGIAKIVNENVTDIEMVATTPAQIAQSPTMLQTKEAMFGIGMACMFERAYEGVEEFAGKPHSDLVQIAAMYDNVMSFVVMADSPLKSVKDINEKTVISSTATNVMLTKAVVKSAGVVKDPEKLDFRIMSYQQGAEALSDGNADMVILTGFPKNGTLDSIATTKGVRLLEVDDETRQKFDKDYPKWKMLKIPSNTYNGQNQDIWSPTIYTVMYANRNSLDNDVYEVVKTCIENVEELALIHPTGKDFTNETTARYLETGIMSVERMHPGAIKYFKEVGVVK